MKARQQGVRAASFAALFLVLLSGLSPARAGLWDLVKGSRGPIVTPLAAPAEPTPAAQAPTPLLYAISDLHIGEGTRANGKVSPLEDFVVDKELEQFVEHALKTQQTRGDPRAKLVLHGDVFDFLKVTTAPTGETLPERTSKEVADDDIAAPPKLAAQKMRRIVEAHPGVIAAMRRWTEAGNELVLIAGNHDQELFYGEVRSVLRKALGKGAKQMRFEPAMHLDGDVLIEHGQRYDPMNSVSHMLYPFSGKGRDQRLRPSVGNFVVVKLNNRMKEKVPELNYLARGRAMLKAVLRRAPREALSMLPFALELAGQTGLRAPSHASAEVIAMHERIRAHEPRVEELRATVNMTREARGQEPLSKAGMTALLQEWDGQAARPYLETMNLGKNRFRGLLHLLRPSQFKKWLDATLGNSTPQALELAFGEMANIHVQGHTHVPGIEDATPPIPLRARAGARPRDRARKWVVNTGTWIPSMSHDHRVDPTGQLTFVEITRDQGVSTPRLLRWDAKSGTAVEATNAAHRPLERGRTARPGRRAPIIGAIVAPLGMVARPIGRVAARIARAGR